METKRTRKSPIPRPDSTTQYRASPAARRCSVEGCASERYTARGLCPVHYQQAKREGWLPERRVWIPSHCSIEGCDRVVRSLGLCDMHYQRQRHGTPMDRLPIGGGHINQWGYREIGSGKGGRSVLEHRVVMEQAIGRPLRPGETVHHKNGIRHDNRLQNLELRTSPHGPGQRVEEVLEWAREYVRTYGPVVRRLRVAQQVATGEQLTLS